MERIMFEEKRGSAMNKMDIIYSGLLSILIAILIVFGFVWLLGIDLASCNLIRLVLVYFGVLIVSWVILLLRKC